jgi:hypothetical protein
MSEKWSLPKPATEFSIQSHSDSQAFLKHGLRQDQKTHSDLILT